MIRRICLLLLLSAMCYSALATQRMEALDRGLVALKQDEQNVFLSWRLLGDDPEGIAFNLYRLTQNKPPLRLNEKPLAGATNFVDRGAPVDSELTYELRVVLQNEETDHKTLVSVWKQPYLEIPIERIPGYHPGDGSVGDLDGDGQLDIVLHQISRPKDNSFAGITGEPILEAYRFNGEKLWQIRLGKNIREGEHYTQFMVYDLDGDGRAEVVCKTADGTIDGQGNVIGDPEKDWRTIDKGSIRHGHVLDGPEFMTLFDGATGEALATADYIPTRDPIDGWGGIGGNAGNDSYGNRCDRFLACVAYLDGELPSVVMCRGVYGRIAITAWDWQNHKLSVRWKFDTGPSYPPYDQASPYAGMGGHSLTAGDIDKDGRDEIVYQAMVVDDDGTGIYSTGLRHGDSMHLADIDVERSGLEVFTVQENEEHADRYQTPAAALRDARTGEILWSHHPTVDSTYGMSADIDPTHPGMESWAAVGGLYNAQGKSIGESPKYYNWCLWWDGDPLRELLYSKGNLRRLQSQRDQPDHQRKFNDTDRTNPTRIMKWNWKIQQAEQIFECDSICLGKWPVLVGDLIGDWREEILLVSPDGGSLRLYTTTLPTKLRLTTLLHDPQYRLGIARQNVVYNAPAHPSFFLGEGMTMPPKQAITIDR